MIKPTAAQAALLCSLLDFPTSTAALRLSQKARERVAAGELSFADMRGNSLVSAWLSSIAGRKGGAGLRGRRRPGLGSASSNLRSRQSVAPSRLQARRVFCLPCVKGTNIVSIVVEVAGEPRGKGRPNSPEAATPTRPLRRAATKRRCGTQAQQEMNGRPPLEGSARDRGDGDVPGPGQLAEEQA